MIPKPQNHHTDGNLYNSRWLCDQLVYEQLQDMRFREYNTEFLVKLTLCAKRTSSQVSLKNYGLFECTDELE